MKAVNRLRKGKTCEGYMDLLWGGLIYKLG